MKQSKYLLITIAVVMIAFFSISKIYDVIDLNRSFQGAVQKVEYAENKGTPTATVNNVAYFLSANINFEREIEVGDTISKKKGEQVYKLTKRNSGKTIIFGD
ncbi:hypothetical protein ABIB62_001887 [Mucilaginibacter sp. UYP25]|uniref:hypothetical protein n=1 Tax=unclassified Mucilaginibacter TaxID=2617802 RepID=UPI003392076E